jgi:hypothetical protein
MMTHFYAFYKVQCAFRLHYLFAYTSFYIFVTLSVKLSSILFFTYSLTQQSEFFLSLGENERKKRRAEAKKTNICR